MLPAVVEALDGRDPLLAVVAVAGRRGADHAAGEARGDSHFWDVWHAQQPGEGLREVELPLRVRIRHAELQLAGDPGDLLPARDANIFGAAMENHQKNKGGNQVILDYVSRRYRFPKDQAALIYLRS